MIDAMDTRNRNVTSNEPIVAWHFIICAYGFWLPNDPRGSWSRFVRSPEILAAGGPATGRNIRRSVAAIKHDVATRLAAKEAMMYPPVRFTGLQARAVARGIAIAVRKNRHVVRECAIMPDHVHIVMDINRRKTSYIAGHLKARTAQQMNIENVHPHATFADVNRKSPSVWSHGHWCVFIHPSELDRAIRYVQTNPIKAGMKRQSWGFITPLN